MLDRTGRIIQVLFSKMVVHVDHKMERDDVIQQVEKLSCDASFCEKRDKLEHVDTLPCFILLDKTYVIRISRYVLTKLKTSISFPCQPVLQTPLATASPRRTMSGFRSG